MQNQISYWWVNQGQAHKAQKEGGFLWSPKKNKNGTALKHHNDLMKVNVGDVVFVYSNKEVKAISLVKSAPITNKNPFYNDQWGEDGNFVEVSYFDMKVPVMKDDIPKNWRLEENGPFDNFGNIKQGYFYAISNEFSQKFASKFYNHFPDNIMDKFDFLDINTEIINETYSYKQLVDHTYSYIKNKGFYYEREELSNFFLSLKTKPFVILSGISGTGKTKIVQWFAEAIGATEENSQFTLIPVQPDWSDGTDLLGYTDIKGDFKEGPLTKVIKDALNNPNKPYIVLLDEMNLARVEYYFSDILSVMESRKWKNGKIETSTLLSKEVAGEDIPLPSNVYIVGTVNMDETTHPFSKKVLDRANTIEFNRVKLSHLEFLLDQEEIEPISIDQEVLDTNYLHLKDVYQNNPEIVRSVTDELESINNVLQKIQAHVGYRVRDEICMYMAYNEEGSLMDFNTAFDHCLLQKILPRIAGSDSRVQDVIHDLIDISAPGLITEDTDEDMDLTYAKYPKSTAKLVEMRRRLVDGFTSFWIS
ncbi:5-methylcytosine-specific restriction endonuclease McrBC, GTP-binding regulatory subunit McrB [Salinibacillus kushneri]|uniref:5-methylcytosine-specific restriction endonuclease McrBC, GTP-binding regulatory subunit McrB n=1 Tax=Salinibacillus kushneri TaxID=237682 RepID=A0A1I0EXV9_9BACI|nr:AAA family ATPase [Salinibacillus kushneri]SET50305.1 5-methylcytosine-specific restriction endonuclease McrBC, GTP-binding regulatory subunit McrB [Salinibacillus kushneri]